MKKILFSCMVVCAFQMSYAQICNELLQTFQQGRDDAQKKYEKYECNKRTQQENSSISPQKQPVYVDLGLPSGTLWKDQNEDSGFYTYEEAVAKFGNNLPTKEQLEELKDFCRWSWTGSGYKVEGPSGESITLPAAGYRYCGDSVYGVGSYGYCWSSTPYDSEGAWYLYFTSSEVYVGSLNRCDGRSVRLVR